MANHFNTILICLGHSESLSSKLKIITPPKNKFYKYLYLNFQFIKILKSINKTHKIDFLYMRTYGALLSPYFSKLFVNDLKIGVEINGILLESFDNKKWLQSILHKAYKKIFQYVDVFSASKGYIKYVKNSFGVKDQQTLSLNLGYSPSFTLHEKSKALEKIKAELDTTYLMFIGNIAKYQGLQFIVNTFIRKQTWSKKVKVLIVGEGSYRKEIEKLIKDNGVERFFEYRGLVSKKELDYYLSIGAIGLSTFSPDRGLKGTISGLKTFDYLFHKMPIITSCMDDMAGFISSNNLGWVVKDFTEEEISTIIEEAIHSEDAIKKAYQEKYKYITDTFNWDNRFENITQRIKKTLA